MSSSSVFKAVPFDRLTVSGTRARRRGLIASRFEANRRYLMSLRSRNLLQNFHFEAGLSPRPGIGGHTPIPATDPDDGDFDTWHQGWETPTCQIRGHFLGHWLAAASRTYVDTGDAEIKAKIDGIIAELDRCQRVNGGEWVGSTPEKYMDWIAEGVDVWAPQYVHHKTLHGLMAAYRYAGNEQALEILTKWSRWFHRWTGRFTERQLERIMAYETGGMMEVWADVYSVTGEPMHLELMRRYERRQLFDALVEGRDVMTNMHAFTNMYEVLGAARAWEVTGEPRWRRVVEGFWRLAVTERGCYCTGGTTNGEVWSPFGKLAARLGPKTQEHCCVHNMMRIADYLTRWTGDAQYADYWERNLYNGVLAQQHPRTGLVSYFLPMRAGSTKEWAHPTKTFWCCLGALVEAQAGHSGSVYYEDATGLVVSQYTPTHLRWEWQGQPVDVRLDLDTQTGHMFDFENAPPVASRPQSIAFTLAIDCAAPTEFELKVRLPAWLAGDPVVTVNGERQELRGAPSSYARLRRTWHQDAVRVELPKALTACPLPDDRNTVAFLDGPVVLAGLCDEERTLYGDPTRPETLLQPDNEREWMNWHLEYRTRDQDRGIRFKPLYEVVDERFALYFPVRDAAAR